MQDQTIGLKRALYLFHQQGLVMVNYRYVMARNLYFTGREMQILILLICGYNNPKMAENLKISARTIEFYMANVKSKLHCYTRYQLLKKILNEKMLGQLWRCLQLQ